MSNERSSILTPAEIERIKADDASYYHDEEKQSDREIAVQRRALLAHLDAITPREVDENALGQMARTFAYPGSRASETFRNMPQYERQKWIDIAVPIYHLGYAAGRLAGEARPPGATCEDCATLRERLATAESERDEARAEAGALVEQRELIRSELRAHGSETTQRAAARLTAELAAEREELASAREGCRGYAVRIKRETEQARDEGAREERGAIAAYLREEGQDSTAMRVLRARGAR